MVDMFISGPTHCTTNSQAGNAVADASHLTLTVNPGGKAAHLYLNPTNFICIEILRATVTEFCCPWSTNQTQGCFGGR